MAGYNYSAGMSNNAVAAYAVGCKPLSQISLADLRAAGWTGTKRLAVALAKDGFWTAAEWHHSGGTWYNKVDFFEPEHLVDAWADLEPTQRAELEAKHAKATEKTEPEGRKVRGSYAEWGGTRRRPAIVGKVEFTGRLIGDWIHIDGGGRKKASGNHIVWVYA